MVNSAKFDLFKPLVEISIEVVREYQLKLNRDGYKNRTINVCLFLFLKPLSTTRSVFTLVTVIKFVWGFAHYYDSSKIEQCFIDLIKYGCPKVSVVFDQGFGRRQTLEFVYNRSLGIQVGRSPVDGVSQLLS